MISISSLILYILIFVSVYVQVFFLLTLLENRRKIVVRKNKITLAKYPGVTIIVPCWNEEKTVYQTVCSLLELNYPKNKLQIFLIDDGSTDSTFSVISSFSKYPNVKIFSKKNGGKYTALNLGLEKVATEFLGCLDADSIVDPEALVRIMSYFDHDVNAMAVVPSVNVSGAKNMIQKAQMAEYHMGIYMKKMLDFLGAINVTPGPFTIFRKKVFNDLGPYRHAHNTEDMEIAYRMQEFKYKIVHCNDAYVYTNSPATIKKLYKQRSRWIYGFINNTLDYRRVWLNKKYGNFALFTLPTGVVSIIAVSYIFFQMIYSTGEFVYTKLIKFQTIGFDFGGGSNSFDLFFIETNMSLFLVILIYSSVMFAIVFGSKMSDGKWKLSLNMLYFLVIFRLIAPFWIMKAVYRTVIGRAPAWR